MGHRELMTRSLRVVRAPGESTLRNRNRGELHLGVTRGAEVRQIAS